jgi:hypothetical protein
MKNKIKFLLNSIAIFVSFSISLFVFSLIPATHQEVLVKITAVVTIIVLFVGLFLNGFILLRTSTLCSFWKKIAYISGFSMFSMLVMYVLYQLGFETIKEHVSQFGFDIATSAMVIVNILQSFVIFSKNKEVSIDGNTNINSDNK